MGREAQLYGEGEMMADIEKKLAFLLCTSPYLDTLDNSYKEAARDLIANGVTIEAEPPKVALEDVVDLDAQAKANNAAMRKVIAFIMEG